MVVQRFDCQEELGRTIHNSSACVLSHSINPSEKRIAQQRRLQNHFDSNQDRSRDFFACMTQFDLNGVSSIFFDFSIDSVLEIPLGHWTPIESV